MNQVVNGCGSCVSQALHYMLLVSEVEETEIFKICLEYWNHLAAELYRESPFSTSTSPLLSDVPPRRHLYLPVLSKVRPGSVAQQGWGFVSSPGPSNAENLCIHIIAICCFGIFFPQSKNANENNTYSHFNL